MSECEVEEGEKEGRLFLASFLPRRPTADGSILVVCLHCQCACVRLVCFPATVAASVILLSFGSFPRLLDRSNVALICVFTLGPSGGLEGDCHLKNIFYKVDFFISSSKEEFCA